MAYTKNNIKFNTFDGNISSLTKKIGNRIYLGATVDDLSIIEGANNGQLPTTFNALEIDWNGADLSSSLGSSYSSIKTTAQLLSAIKEASTRGGTTLPNNLGKSAGTVLTSSNNSQRAIGQTIDNTVPVWSTSEPAVLTGLLCNEYGCIDKIYAASKNEFIKWLDIQSGEIVSSYEIEFDMSAFVDLFNTRDLGITSSTLRTRTTKGNVIFWFVGQSRVSLSCDIVYQYDTAANDGSFTITVSTPNTKVINNIERTFIWANPFIKTGFTIIDNNNAYTAEFDNVKYSLTRTSATTSTEYGTTYLKTTFSGKWDSAAWPSVTPSIEPSDGNTYTIESEQAFQEFYITNSTPINIYNIFGISNLDQLMLHRTFDLDPTYRKTISVNITIESTEDGKTYTGKCNLPATIRYNEELDTIDLEVLTNYIYQQQVFPGQNVTIMGANIYNMTLSGAWTMDQIYDESITLEQLIQHNSSLAGAIQWGPNVTYSDYQANVINYELFGPQAQRSIKKDITIVDNYEMKKYPFVNISFDVASSITDSILKIKFGGKTYNLSAVRTYEDNSAYYMSDRINIDNGKDWNRVHRLVFQYNVTTQKETDKIRLDGVGSRMNILDMMGADFCDAFDPYKIDSDNENNYNNMINDRYDYTSTYNQYISSNRENVPIDIQLYFDPGNSNVSSIENTEFKLIFTINNTLYDNKYNYEFENSPYIISEYKNSRIIFLNDNKSRYSVTEYYVSNVYIVDTVLILSIKTNNSSYSYSGQQPIYIENLAHYCELSYPYKLFLDNIKSTISKTYVENSFESLTHRKLGPVYLNTLVTCNHPGYKIDENIKCQVQVELAKEYIEDVSRFNIPDNENYIKVSITLPLKVETTTNHGKIYTDNVDYPMDLQTYYWKSDISQSNIKNILSFITKNESTYYFECFGYTTTISDTLYEMADKTVTTDNNTTIPYKPYQYTYYVDGNTPKTEIRNDVLVLYLKYTQKEVLPLPTPTSSETSPEVIPSPNIYVVETKTSTQQLCSTIEWAICESYLHNQNNLRKTNIDVLDDRGGGTILYDGLFGPDKVADGTYPQPQPIVAVTLPPGISTAPPSSLDNKVNFNKYKFNNNDIIQADAYVLKYATLYVQQAIRYKYHEEKTYSDNSTSTKNTYETIRRLPPYGNNGAYNKSTYSGAGFSAKQLPSPIFWNRTSYCKIWKIVESDDNGHYTLQPTGEYDLVIEAADSTGYMYKIRLVNTNTTTTANNEYAVFVEAWVAIPDSSESVVAIPVTLLFAPNPAAIDPSGSATPDPGEAV